MGFVIVNDNVSAAWLEAINYLFHQPNKECNNLLVEINNPLRYDRNIEDAYEKFCYLNKIKHFSIPACTIFPKKAFHILGNDRFKLYKKYYRLHKVLKGMWGSYFGQMIGWSLKNHNDFEPVNQVENIIKMINSRDRIFSSAYTIQITNPVDHSAYTRGGPCLHYIFFQLKSNRSIDILAVYRNQDFAIKAYGNYVGLGHFLEFICHETDFTVGKLSCLSSHAFIPREHVSKLKEIMGELHE